MAESSLGGLLSTHRWLWIYCDGGNCDNRIAVPLAPFVIRWGPVARGSKLADAFKCTVCGHKGGLLRAESWGSERKETPFPIGKVLKPWPELDTRAYRELVRRKGKDGPMKFTQAEWWGTVRLARH